MSKLLTIAIPTFNRLEFLDKQLTWLAQDIKGFESECEILVSDNCSTDDTQDLIKKWQHNFRNTTFKVNRHNKNIGLMQNFAYCLQAATTNYVWVVGDDDIIQEGTVGHVLNNLKEHPDLSLLLLNFSVRSIPTGEIVFERVFTIENEQERADGKEVIEHYLATDHCGLGFITAAIYRTDAVKLALKKWYKSVNNLEGQTYWTAFCATQGSVKITKQTYIEYASGMLFDAKPKIWFKMFYADIIKVYTKLSDIGYSEKLSRQVILKHFIEKNNWKVVLGALRRWPILAINTIVPYLVLVGVSAAKNLLSPSVVKDITVCRK